MTPDRIPLKEIYWRTAAVTAVSTIHIAGNMIGVVRAIRCGRINARYCRPRVLTIANTNASGSTTVADNMFGVV